MNYEIVSAKTCPYVQRVMILLEEKGIEYTHKVPLLKLPNGHVLFESQVINEYLDEVERPELHPADPIEKAENRAWIELVSSIIMSFGGYYYATDQETMDDRSWP